MPGPHFLLFRVAVQRPRVASAIARLAGARGPPFPAMSLAICVAPRVTFCRAIGAPPGPPNRPVWAGRGAYIWNVRGHAPHACGGAQGLNRDAPKAARAALAQRGRATDC